MKEDELVQGQFKNVASDTTGCIRARSKCQVPGQALCPVIYFNSSDNRGRGGGVYPVILYILHAGGDSYQRFLGMFPGTLVPLMPKPVAWYLSLEQ